jgi:hypothetical protein
LCSSGGGIGIDSLHVPLLTVLKKLVPLNSFAERAMEGRVTILPAPRFGRGDGAVNLVSITRVGAYARSVDINTGNGIRHVYTAVIVAPCGLRVTPFRVGLRPCVYHCSSNTVAC